jgi:signal transduction histidine kinase
MRKGINFMDNKTGKILNIILWIFLMWSSVYILTYEANNSTVLALLIAFLCLSILFSNHLAEKFKIKESTYKINLFLNSALIYWITLLDSSGASQILFFILTSYMIIIFSIKYGLICAGINFLSFVLIDYIKLDNATISIMIPRILQYLLNFGFVFGFSFVAKFEIIQRERLDKTKKELEKAYEKLQESYDAKEQLLIERERNKIAGEIHDTVGHTLTTVIVELEAAKRLMKKDMDLSLEKLDLAQEQVRKGLNDIRKSVRALKNGEEVLDFTASIVSLIEETEKHSGVSIQYTLDEFSDMDVAIHRVLLRALQEGLTNGIRHGQSNEFKLFIKNINGNIVFSLSDNGCGAEGLEFGFGLSNMRYRVEQLNGKLSVSLQKNKGCIITIEIPFGKGKKNGEN